MSSGGSNRSRFFRFKRKFAGGSNQGGPSKKPLTVKAKLTDAANSGEDKDNNIVTSDNGCDDDSALRVGYL